VDTAAAHTNPGRACQLLGDQDDEGEIHLKFTVFASAAASFDRRSAKQAKLAQKMLKPAQLMRLTLVP
jgi:hypothetical protein